MQVDLQDPLISLEWLKEKDTLPDGVQHTQAALLGDRVYFGGGLTDNPENETKIFVFNYKTKATEKPLSTEGPTCWSALATFCSKLVLIGGSIRGKATYQLWALQDDGHTWEQPFAPMAQACWGASAVGTDEHLIVAGGVKDNPATPLRIVQIYNVNTRKWGVVTSLPTGCYFMKTTLHDGTWYVGGGRWQDRKVFRTSLKSLVAALTSNHAERDVWKELPDLSVRCSTLAMCEGQLIAVGGTVQATGPTREIKVYDVKNNSWVHVESFPVPCDSMSSLVLPNKEILFAGGNLEFFDQRLSTNIYRAKIKGKQ